MLQTTPRSSEYVTISGQIDMSDVFRSAHRSAALVWADRKAVAAARQAPVKGTYREVFAKCLREQLAIARKLLAISLTGIPLDETYVFVPAHGRKVRFAGGICQE